MLLECNPGCDLRAVQHRVEEKATVFVIDAQCPITDLSENVTGQVNTDHGLDFPHQVSADTEPADLAAYGRVEHFVEIVSAAQPKIGIEPVILPRDRLTQLRVENTGKLIRDLGLGRVNCTGDCRATSVALWMSASMRIRRAVSFATIKS